jgi:predicted ATPase/DNA-binding CsgD family transcriptional regulator
MATTVLARGNLPADLTSFVGRRTELAHVRQQLGEFRIVTLIGAGGVGKTRLAMRVASQSERVFPDGVWLVELAALRDQGLVAHQVAAALGLREGSNRPALMVLGEYLAARQALIVLDNCEHLLDGCAALVESLLRAAPSLRILATSRERLAIIGECVIAVPALSAPPLNDSPPTPDGMNAYDATSLFVDRARAVAPSFALTAENAAAVARLLNRLDGLPLAIELAAARVRMLSPAQMVDRLQQGYGLLRSTSRTSLPHRRSMEALIDWSYQLCSEEERVLWNRMSVFPRDFDIDAAEQICGDLDNAKDLLEPLAGLVDKSILNANGDGERVRYRLPESLRKYGAVRLGAAGDRRRMELRHCEYYAHLARQALREWFGPRQLEWTAWLDAEYVNLRAVLELSLVDPAASTGRSVAPALGFHWLLSGSLDEGRRLIDRAVAVDAMPHRGKAMMLSLLSWLAIHQGDMNGARSAGQASLDLTDETGDRLTYGYAKLSLGLERIAAGDADSAQQFFEAALAGGTKGTGPVAIAALRGMAGVAEVRGNPELQSDFLRRGVEVSEAAGESWERAATLWSLAVLEWKHADLSRAEALARDSLRARSRFHDRVGIAQCLEVLAWCASARKNFERAGFFIAAAEMLWRDVGAAIFPSLAAYHADSDRLTVAALGLPALAARRSKVAEMSLDDIIARALDAPSVRGPDAPSSGLTPREQQVAELIAEGLSNREIAARMVVSLRTAEGHVEHILVKLGFSTRAQIAAWVAQRRPRDSAN